MQNIIKPRWISSLGGPFILMDRLTVHVWKGDSNHSNAANSGFVSDYERACQIQDFIGTLFVGADQALILGDLPSNTTHVPIDSLSFLLIRWIWADSEDQITNALREFKVEQSWRDTGIHVLFRSGQLVLFDSVYGGNEMKDYLNIEVDAGNYHVSTLSYQPNDLINLFIVKIAKD